MTEPERHAPPLTLIHALNALNDTTATDTGNVKLFVRRFGDIVRYVPETKTWLIWCGTHWEPDVLGAVYELTEQIAVMLRERAMELTDEGADSPRQVMLRHAMRTESGSARQRIVEMVRSHPQVAVKMGDIDPADDTITCPNGVVDVLTREIKAHTPDRLVTSCTSVAYDPEATSPLLDQYLETFMPDPDDQRLLFAVLGHALRGGNAGRKLPLFLGASTSGKSMLVGTVAKILRGYAVSISSSVFRGSLDDRPRPDLIRAVRARVAFAHEAAQTWDLHGDQIKRLTGSDVIPVRTLFKEQVEVQPTFTPIIIANEMPRIRGADNALKRRLIVVRFGRSLPDDQVDIEARRVFENDAQTRKALLARMVAGASDSLDVVNWPESAVNALAEAFDEVDHVALFLSWLQEQGHLQKVDDDTAVGRCAKAGDLHAWYVSWVRKHGDRADREAMMNMRAFGSALRSRGWESGVAMGVRWKGWALVTDAPWL